MASFLPKWMAPSHFGANASAALDAAASTATAAARLPALFIAHGSPMAGIDTSDPMVPFYRKIGARVLNELKPRAIVVVSAHWETDGIHEVSTMPEQSVIYDFGGFPDALYRVKYPVLGAPDVAEEVMEVLKARKIPVRANPKRGLDHGAWVPLINMLPPRAVKDAAGEESKPPTKMAPIPVLQLSLRYDTSMRECIELGEALAPLRERNILLMGSGTTVHNLRALFRVMAGQKDPEFDRTAEDFISKLNSAIVNTKTAEERREALLRLGSFPGLHLMHPSLEHLLPTYVIAGAGLGDPAKLLHSVVTVGLYLNSFQFD